MRIKKYDLNHIRLKDNRKQNKLKADRFLKITLRKIIFCVGK